MQETSSCSVALSSEEATSESYQPAEAEYNKARLGKETCNAKFVRELLADRSGVLAYERSLRIKDEGEGCVIFIRLLSQRCQ